MNYRQPPLSVNPHLDTFHNPAPWKNSPCWGQNVVLQNVFVGATPNLSIPREVFKLDTNAEPTVITVQTTLFNDVRGTDSYAVVGLLRYGSGAGIQEVEFDWLNGTQLTVTSNSLMLLCYIEGIQTDLPSVPPALSISALVAKGPRAGGFSPQRTQTVRVEATGVAAATQNITIPDKARAAILYDGDNAYNALVTVQTFSGSGVLISNFTLADLKPATVQGRGFIIPAGAQFMQIHNGSGTAYIVSAVFLLDL